MDVFSSLGQYTISHGPAAAFQVWEVWLKLPPVCLSCCCCQLVAVQECVARARQEGLLPRAFSKVCSVVWFCQGWGWEEVFWAVTEHSFRCVCDSTPLHVISSTLGLRDFWSFVCHNNRFSLAFSEDFQDTALIELGESGELVYLSSGCSQGKVKIPRGI